MASYNRVVLMGNLTRDVQLRSTPGGLPITDVGLAVNDKRKQGDEWVDEVTFVDVTIFGKPAEVASEYLSKGSPLFIEGRLKLDTWEKDGVKHYKHKVICDRMQLIGGKSEGGGQSRSEAPRQSSSQTHYVEPEDDPNSIPF